MTFYPGDEKGDATWGSVLLFVVMLLMLFGIGKWGQHCGCIDSTKDVQEVVED